MNTLILVNQIALVANIFCLLVGMLICFAADKSFSGLRLLLTLGIGLALVLAFYYGWIPESTNTQQRLQVLIGDLMLFVANGLFWWAIAQHHHKPSKIFDATLPHELVTTGPYSFIRHPLYTAYLLALLAIAFIAKTAPIMAFMSVLGAVYVFAAFREETGILQSGHRGVYRDYMQRTGRFLPQWKKFHLRI